MLAYSMICDFCWVMLKCCHLYVPVFFVFSLVMYWLICRIGDFEGIRLVKNVRNSQSDTNYFTVSLIMKIIVTSIQLNSFFQQISIFCWAHADSFLTLPLLSMPKLQIFWAQVNTTKSWWEHCTIHELSTPKTIVITVTKEFSKWKMVIGNLLKKDKCWKPNTDKSDIQARILELHIGTMKLLNPRDFVWFNFGKRRLYTE